MLALTVSSIRDLMACELFFQLRHLEKEHVPTAYKTILAARFENTMHRIATFFFYKRQQGQTPSYSVLLSRWEKIWFPKNYDAYDLAVEQHSTVSGNYASYTSLAAVALLRFYEDFTDPLAGDPIAIDEPFVVPLGQDFRLEGSFDLVLRRGNEHHVILWTMSRQPNLNHNVLDFAAQRLAYERGRGRDWKDVNVSYGLYSLSSAHSGIIEADPNADDVAALLYWARKAHESETFVPRRGFTTYCRGCVFDDQCAAWKKWPR
jgi:hypothetical protein